MIIHIFLRIRNQYFVKPFLFDIFPLASVEGAVRQLVFIRLLLALKYFSELNLESTLKSVYF